MRVVFVNPAIAWDALDASWIRHGIAQLSAVCVQAGHRTALLDCRRYAEDGQVKWEAFDLALKRQAADVFCVSVLSANFDFAKEAIARIRAKYPKARIVAGGIHVSVATEESEKLGADVLVRGEGEEVILTILKTIEQKPDFPILPAVVEGPRPDLSTLPFCDRRLFHPVRELPIGYLAEPFHTIIIGRGCPHRCTFCQPAERTLFGAKVRMRSVEHVIGELQALHAGYGLASFLIHDDCFSAFPAYAEEFASALSRSFPSATWYCQARADHIVKRPELFRLLAQAGLRGCLVGFESGSDRLLSWLKKDTDTETNLKAAEVLHNCGLHIWANLMVGLPTETPAEAMETVFMARQIKGIQPQALLSWAMFTPHPGSELFDYCNEQGINLVRSHADYRRYFEANNPKIEGPDYQYLAWAVNQV